MMFYIFCCLLGAVLVTQLFLVVIHVQLHDVLLAMHETIAALARLEGVKHD